MARILSLAVVTGLVVTIVTASAAQAADPIAKATAPAAKATTPATKAPAATAPTKSAPAVTAQSTAPAAPRTVTRSYRRYSYNPDMYVGGYRINSRSYANGIRDAASKSLGRNQPWSR